MSMASSDIAAAPDATAKPRMLDDDSFPTSAVMDSPASSEGLPVET